MLEELLRGNLDVGGIIDALGIESMADNSTHITAEEFFANLGINPEKSRYRRFRRFGDAQIPMGLLDSVKNIIHKLRRDAVNELANAYNSDKVPFSAKVRNFMNLLNDFIYYSAFGKFKLERIQSHYEYYLDKMRQKYKRYIARIEEVKPIIADRILEPYFQ